MSTAELPRSHVRMEPEAPPLLQSGDRLDQPTFHAIYQTMPDDFKAELIEGTVFVAPQVSDDHSTDHADIVVWAGFYRVHTPGVRLNDNGTVILGPKNQPQPDAALRDRPGPGRPDSGREYLFYRPTYRFLADWATHDLDLSSGTVADEASGSALRAGLRGVGAAEPIADALARRRDALAGLRQH